jgi:TonB-dependent starch-binding outer membrane protein SusC
MKNRLCVFGKARFIFALLTGLCLSILSFSQTRVTGKVSGPDSKPLFGVTITAKGTNVATTSGADGAYAIVMPPKSDVLIFSSVGYEVSEVNVRGHNEIDVAMKIATTSLNEVVVTGYTAQRKKDITGAVSVVNVAEMKQLPATTGEEALQGRASGVTVISSAQPGAASDIRIRGVTSYGNNNPLVIVDGVRGSIHDLNPNDIESIQVLKDASAAIYGVQGSNGVIIVTTKRGKTGRAKVSYDAYFGVTTQGTGFDMANTQEEANAIWQQMKNSGLNPGDKNFYNPQYGKGATPVVPDYIQTYDPKKNGFPSPLPTDTNGHTIYGWTKCNCPADSIVDASKYYDINSAQITLANKNGTDWYKEITRNAFVQQHNLSVSAGGEKSSYYFSINYLDQDGILKYQYLKRYGVRMNTLFNVKNNIRVGENAYMFYKDNPIFGNQGEGSPFTTAYREDAIIPVYDVAGNFAGTKSQGLGNARNPYADIYRTKDNHGYNWDMTGNIFAELDFLRHFTARTSFGGTVDNNWFYNFGYVGYENAEGNTGANSFSEGGGYSTVTTFTNTLTYGNIFAEKHSLRLLAGTEAVRSYYRYASGTRSSYFSELPIYWTLNSGTGSQSNAGGAGQYASMSFISKLEYSYANKYLVNASFRRDGTSKFAEDYRWGWFPGVSVAWRASEEGFFRNISWISDLKVRASWAKLASDLNVDPTNAYNLYATRLGKSAYDISGTSTAPYAGFYRSNIGNVSTTWEQDIISNIGIDAVILKNKLDFTVEYYKKKISGLLFDLSGVASGVMIIGDAAVPKVNIGNIQNAGVDVNVTYHATVAKDLKLDLTGIFTSYKNKIVDIPGVNYIDGVTIRNNKLQRYEEGHPFGAFFGYKVVGIFQDAADIAKSPKQDDAIPGVFKYQDVNGDGKITTDDRTYIGDPNPKFNYGFNITATYKNFDFSTFFFGSEGNDIFNNTLYFTDFPDFFKGGIRREAATNSWTPSNPGAKIPLLRTTGGFSTDNSGYANSYFISKGSYLRNKQMQLGYTLPNKLLSKYGIDRLRVYVQATNLFTITKYNGLDPELPSQPDSNGRIVNTFEYGIDQGSYPHTPGYLFGINLNF